MDKQISRQFFNSKAAHWDETPRSNDPSRLQAMANRLDFEPGALVMDVGTGTGVLIPFLQKKMNDSGRIICIDFAFSMLEIALEKNGNSRVGHICAEIETVGFDAEIFDAAVCYSTFPHFHDKPLALENIFKLLAPGGRVFICHTASRERINAVHRKIPDFADHLIPDHEEMRNMMDFAGFRETKIVEGEQYYLAYGSKPID